MYGVSAKPLDPVKLVATSRSRSLDLVAKDMSQCKLSGYVREIDGPEFSSFTSFNLKKSTLNNMHYIVISFSKNKK